eukprot:COSAG06_NODE_5160_length_3671_cov_98.829507_5_plen_122_part_00
MVGFLWVDVAAHNDYDAEAVDIAQRHATAALRRLADCRAPEARPGTGAGGAAAAAAAAAGAAGGGGDSGEGRAEGSVVGMAVGGEEVAWAFYTRLWEADQVEPGVRSTPFLEPFLSTRNND